jgi:hypothetical protein
VVEKYRHTSVSCSPGLALALGAGLGALIAALVASGQEEFTVLSVMLCTIPVALFPLIIVWITALNVEVDGGRLRWRFGYGGPGWSVAVADIQRVGDIQFNGLNGGIGIRGLPWARFGGFNYCVGLRQGVQVELRNGRQFGIETDEPKTLAFVLREAMKATEQN